MVRLRESCLTVKEPLFRTLSTCRWQEGRKKLTHPPAWGLPFLGDICKINGLFTLFPHLSPTLPSLIHKKNLASRPTVRWLFWDASLPSSLSAGSPNKVIFLVSTPHLGFTGFISLLCGEQSVLGLSNRRRAQALGEQMEQVPWNQMPPVSINPFVLPARLVRNWADPRHGWKCSFHLAKPVCQVYRISDGEKMMTGTPEIMQIENWCMIFNSRKMKSCTRQKM